MPFTFDKKPYVIAEVGANHNGDMKLARRLIRVAKDIGCNAVKFQSWDEGLFAKIVYEENKFLGDDYRQRDDHSLETIMSEYKVTKDDLVQLAAECRAVGIDFSSTPFTPGQIETLVELGAPYVKIASMDLFSDYLLRHAAGTRLPVVLSTGFGTLADIDHAIRTLEKANAACIVVLHCVGLYPPPDDEVHLANIDMLRRAFGYPVGFSDHTLGTEITIASFALGACVVEKHFTLDKTMEGWDHAISADVADMTTICRARDRVPMAIGRSRREPSAAELVRSTEHRRSIVAARDICRGETLTLADLDYKRPGRGIAPNMDTMLVGKVVARDIAADDLLAWSDVGF